MKKILTLCFLLSTLLSIEVNGQCTGNTSQYPSGTVNAGTGDAVTISTCNYTSEYSVITGITAGEDYTFTITGGHYITVVQDGVTLDHASGTVTVTAASGSDITVYWNESAACDTATGCETTTVQCTTCTPPAAPTCADAVALTPGTQQCDDTANGIGDFIDDDGPCGFSSYDNGDDFIFSYTATAADDGMLLTATLDGTENSWAGMFAYEGCPTVLGGTTDVCADSDATSSPGDQVSITLTEGTTYYIHISTYPSPQNTAFCLDATIGVAPPEPNTPSDMCAAPNPLCADAPAVYAANTTGTAEAGNDYGCLSTQPRPSWFYLEVDTDGDFYFSLNNTVDLDFALWGPFADYATATAACGSLSAPIDCSYVGGSTVETPQITGALAGEVYLLLVTAYSSTPTTFSVTSEAGTTGTTNCAIVTCEDTEPITTSGPGGTVCLGGGDGFLTATCPDDGNSYEVVWYDDAAYTIPATETVSNDTLIIPNPGGTTPVTVTRYAQCECTTGLTGGGTVGLTSGGAGNLASLRLAASCPFGLDPGCLPLSATLLDFDGEALEAENLLTWTTLSETNNEYFEVMRSEDGFRFETIGKVLGAGNSVDVLDYSFSDETPANVSYYRLKMVEFDGDFEYSGVVEIRRTKTKAPSIYPNPTEGGLTVEFETVKPSDVEIEVTDVLGRTICAHTISANSGINFYTMDLNNSTGIYFVSVKVEGDTHITKILRK